MIELNKIYNENCLNTMSRMPDKYVDLVITSPPYNMNLRIMKGKYKSRQIVRELSNKYDDFNDNLPIDEFYDLHNKILTELIRVSKMVFYVIAIVTGSKRAFFKIIGDKSDYLKDIIVRDKTNPQPARQHGVFNRRTELILIFEDSNSISRVFSNANFDRGTLDDLWVIKKDAFKSDGVYHGASFPEELVRKIIFNFSKDNDIIYDPFMGKGTVAKVCVNTNRNFVGSEISKKYCDVIMGKLK